MRYKSQNSRVDAEIITSTIKSKSTNKSALEEPENNGDFPLLLPLPIVPMAKISVRQRG